MSQTKCGAFYYLRIYLMILGYVQLRMDFTIVLFCLSSFSVLWRVLVLCACWYPGNNNETTKHRSLANVRIGSESNTFDGLPLQISKWMWCLKGENMVKSVVFISHYEQTKTNILMVWSINKWAAQLRTVPIKKTTTTTTNQNKRKLLVGRLSDLFYLHFLSL